MPRPFPGRRLSWFRVTAVLVGAGLLTAAGASGFRTLEDSRAATGKSWFAGYVDATVTPRFAFETPSSRASRDVVLSFVVAGNGEGDACTPTWGAAYTLDAAAASLDLDRRVARLRQSDGSVVISFGGQRNRELAVACTDPAALKKAYLAVIDRYDVGTIDLDLEGEGLADAAANVRRAEVLSQIQRERREAGHDLAVWLTLPASTTGLTEVGTKAVADTIGRGLRVAGTNVMTMNFGETRGRQQSMADASIAALKATHRQLMVLHERAGKRIGPATAWKRLGATPMLGQNDTPGEILTLADARKLNAFAVQQGLGRMSVWSLNRDRTCGANYADRAIVSNACSGVAQNGVPFAKVLGRGLTGVPDESGEAPSVPETSVPSTTPDDPATSPYPVWGAGTAYPAAAKVVWKHNVYASKWWTRGDLPDNPVLQQHETPWTLVGPVLAGEKPVVVPRLAAYAYPRWRAARVYEKGTRVMLDGTGFEAKWWTQGDNPAAGSSSPEASPWQQLTDAQVREVNARVLPGR